MGTITPTKKLGSASILKNDVYYFDLAKNFNFKQLKFPVEIQSDKTGVTGYSYNDPYKTQFIGQETSFTNLMYTKVLNDDYIMYVGDYTRVIIQHVGGEGKSFTSHFEISLGDSDDWNCSDGAFYRVQNRFYIGCFSRNATADNPGQIKLFTISAASQQIEHTLVIDQSKDAFIQNRLKMTFTENPWAPPSSNNNVFLALYDQSFSGQDVKSNNFYIRFVRSIEFGNPKFYRLATISGLDFDQLQSIHPYKDGLIAVGMRLSAGYIQMALCEWDINIEIACFSETKDTPVTKGLVGLDQRYNRYYEVDSVKKTTKVTTLEGQFTSKDWNTKVIRHIENVDMHEEDKAYIRDYTESEFASCIQWVKGDFDYGYTNLSLFNLDKVSWKKHGSAVANGRSLLFANEIKEGKMKVGIMRPQTPFALVKGHKLSEGKSDVTLSIKDADMDSPVSETGSFTLLDTIYDEILVHGSGNIDVVQGKSAWYAFKTSEIAKGNALTVSVSDSTGNLKGAGYDFLPTTVNFHPPLDTYTHLGVDQNKVVVQNKNELLFYTCTSKVLDIYNCFLKVTVTLEENKEWDNHQRVISDDDIAFIWICNANDCFAIFVNTTTLKHDQVLLTEKKKSLNDAMFSNNYGDEIRLIASYESSIKFWVSKKSAFSFKVWTKIDSSNAPVRQFCPKNIHVCPDSNFVFEAFNDCNGFNQKILKWTINSLPFSYKTSVTGYSDYLDGEFCPMGDEFIVSSKTQNAPIYSFFTQDDLNYWSVPSEFTEGMTNYKHYCLSHSKKAVFYSYNKDKSIYNLMVIYGNRGTQQIKRYPVLKKGMNIIDARAFIGVQANSILHLVFTKEGKPKWYQTFDGPVVKIESTGETGTFHPEFTFSNEKQKYKVQKWVTVKTNEKLEDKIMNENVNRMFKQTERIG